MADNVTSSGVLELIQFSRDRPNIGNLKKLCAKKIAHAKSVALQNISKHDPESVESESEEAKKASKGTITEGVQMYRELYEQNKDFKPIDVILSKTPKQYAKEMMYMDYMGRCSEHIGFPVKAPPFENEGNVFLSIQHTLDDALGKLCKICISACQPGSGRVTRLATKTVPTHTEKVHDGIVINSLVNQCRLQGQPCLQILIEGAYMETEEIIPTAIRILLMTSGNDKQNLTTTKCSLCTSDIIPDQCENGQLSGPLFTKRIEVWSKNAGYNFSDKCTVKCWPQKLLKISEEYRLKFFQGLLDQPSGWEHAANSEKLLAIDVSVLLEDGTPANNVFDFNNNNTAIREIESNDTKNKKMAEEIDVQFKKRLIEMENVMKCITVTYEPACGFKSLVGIDCVVCKKSFRHIPELLFHMYTTYPNLTVSLQRIGASKCKLTLSVKSLNISQLGRENMQFLSDEKREERYDFSKVMQRALCESILFETAEEWDLREMLDIDDLLENEVLCHVCQINPSEYVNYLIGRRSLPHILFPEPSFNRDFFFVLLRAFLSKTRCHGFDSLEEYKLMRMFLHCHALLFRENAFDFKTCFENFLLLHWDGIFEGSKLDPVLRTDLLFRSKDDTYSECGEDASWMYIDLWGQKEEFEEMHEKEFDKLKQIVSRNMPVGDEQRERVMNKICSDPLSAEITMFLVIRNGMKDELGEPIFIPKCFYFGAAQEDDDVLSHNTYYEN